MDKLLSLFKNIQNAKDIDNKNQIYLIFLYLKNQIFIFRGIFFISSMVIYKVWIHIYIGRQREIRDFVTS